MKLPERKQCWNPQIQERMLLRKLMNCSSFYLPTDHRPRRWAGPGKRPKEVSVGAGRALWVDRWALATAPEAERGTILTLKDFCVLRILISVQLGNQKPPRCFSRKGFNAGD